DLLIGVEQRRDRPPLLPGLFMHSDEALLGHTERRRIEHHAQMAGQSESARVRKSLSIRHKHVGLDAQQFERLKYGRNLSETQESRHVWKGHFAPPLGAIDELQIRQAENGDAALREVFFVGKPAEAYVEPGYRSRGRGQ